MSTLSKKCACGAVAIAAAPTVADIPAALRLPIFAGWGHDERGFCRCPDCMASPAEPAPNLQRIPAASTDPQGSLDL